MIRLAARAALILALIAAYVSHMQSVTGPGTPVFRMLSLSVLLVPVSFYVYILLRRAASVFLPRLSETKREIWVLLIAAAVLLPSMYIFSLSLLFLLHLVVLALACEIFYAVTRLVSSKTAQKIRPLYRSGLVPLCGAILFFAYGFWNMHTVTARTEIIHGGAAIPQAGYTVVFLSDLHFENSMTPADLAHYAEEISAKKPDAVILGGDIVDERTSRAGMHAAFSILGNIPATYGVYYIYGNHDRALYTSEPAFSETELAETIRAAGIHILRDESVTLAPGLTLTGREDRSHERQTGTPRLPHATLAQNLSPDAYHILADHQPREWKEAAAAGFSLLLSGHTHRGQIWPIGLAIEALDKDTFVYGHKKEGNLDFLVSSGIAGWGYPIRTEGHCEYVVVKIVP